MTTPNENTPKLDNQALHLDYYPHWLDSLADDVILQGAVFNGELRGADDVGQMLSFARSRYAFRTAASRQARGLLGGLPLPHPRHRGLPSERRRDLQLVVVYFNDAGQTSQLVMNTGRSRPPCCSRRC